MPIQPNSKPIRLIWLNLQILTALSLLLSACAPAVTPAPTALPTLTPAPTSIFPVIQMTPSLPETEWMSEVQKNWNAANVYFRAADSPTDTTQYRLGKTTSVGEVMTGFQLNAKGEMIVDGVNYGIVGAELSPNTRKAAFLVRKDKTGATQSFFVSELPVTNPAERNFALNNIKGEQVGVLRIVTQTIDGVTGEFLWLNFEDPKDIKKDILLRGFSATASPSPRPTPVPQDLLSIFLNIGVTPVKAEAPTSTATATATKPATATATKPAVTSTKEAPVLQDVQMAKSWAELQANFDGYRASWESLKNGSLAETIRQQIVSKMIKDGTLKVPTDADKPYPLIAGSEVNGYRRIGIKDLQASAVYRPKAIGYIRLAILPGSEAEKILIKNGIYEKDTKNNYFNALVVVHWASELIDGKTVYIPRILFYNADMPGVSEYQKNINANDGIYPYFLIPSGGMYEGFPILPSDTEVEDWVNFGFPSRSLEAKYLLPSTSFKWP